MRAYACGGLCACVNVGVCMREYAWGGHKSVLNVIFSSLFSTFLLRQDLLLNVEFAEQCILPG